MCSLFLHIYMHVFDILVYFYLDVLLGSVQKCLRNHSGCVVLIQEEMGAHDIRSDRCTCTHTCAVRGALTHIHVQYMMHSYTSVTPTFWLPQ